MKTRKLLFVFIGLFLIMVAGCSNEVVNEEQKIEVQIRLDDENNYKDFKEITDNDEVQKVKEIVFDMEWENTKVQMEHPADYRFIFRYNNPDVEAKPSLYELWISPNNDIVEIVKNENEYIKLNEENSSILIETLTYEFISEDEVFVGVKGKLGFLNNKFKENEFQKTVWHFWGESDEIKGIFRVEGTHLETGEKFPILLSGPNIKNATWEFNNGFTQPNLGATKTLPSYAGFGKSGLWKLSVYLDNNHLGEFILEVK